MECKKRFMVIVIGNKHVTMHLGSVARHKGPYLHQKPSESGHFHLIYSSTKLAASMKITLMASQQMGNCKRPLSVNCIYFQQT